MRLPALATAVLLAAASSRADVVFGNMGADGAGGFATNYTLVGSGNISALGFNTGNSSTLYLQSITIGSFIDTTGSFTISLYTGTSSNPNLSTGLFATSSSLTLVNADEEKFTYDFGGTLLSANTVYWVVASTGQSWATSGGFTNATEQNNSGYTFVGNIRSTDSGSTWGNFVPYSISVDATNVVPEPSTYGMILGGLALVGAAVRRRRKSA